MEMPTYDNFVSGDQSLVRPVAITVAYLLGSVVRNKEGCGCGQTDGHEAREPTIPVSDSNSDVIHGVSNRSKAAEAITNSNPYSGEIFLTFKALN